jgi:hypothetical protein
MLWCESLIYLKGALFRRNGFGLQSFSSDGEAMSLFGQVVKALYVKLFPQESRRVFSEEPTRPLDTDTLARALAGEGRSHISTGYASTSPPGEVNARESLYVLVGNSDGLNVLPDFGIVCLTYSPETERKTSSSSQIALSVFSNQIIETAVLEFLELEGSGDVDPLQDLVVEAIKSAERAVANAEFEKEFSLAAGLIFGEIIILGHRGTIKAYHLDRHHIEMITVGGWQGEDTEDKARSSENNSLSRDELDQIMVFSRPVPRDGYILICTEGLWKNMDHYEMRRIVMELEDPQKAVVALINKLEQLHPEQQASVILLYFPPDFGAWR